MRLLLTGAAPWCHGSYGKPLRYLVPLFHEMGHELAIACFYGFGGNVADTHIRGTPVRLYPVVREKYMNDIIAYHVADWEADAVITFQDVWVLKGWGAPRHFLWMAWMPVDIEPPSPPIVDALDGCYMPMSYSQWGRDQLIKAGFPTATYVPIGVDLEINRPMDKASARRSMGLPEDVFMPGMVAANASWPSRKSFPDVLMAWRKWLDQGNDGILYLHTTVTPRRQYGLEFIKCLERLNLLWSSLDDDNPERKAAAKVMFPSQYRMWCHTIDDEELAVIYNAMDVLLSPSKGEGFGMPIVEAQACGVPVITLDHTSMKEITFAGICLEPAQLEWDVQGGFRAVCGVDALVDALKWARDMSTGEKARQYLAEKARAGVTQFDWERTVQEYWKPILQDLEQ